MHRYFKHMPLLGQAMNAGQMKSSEENIARIQEVETAVAQAADKVRNAGFPAERINARGQLTVYQRLDYLVDAGTWCPLHTLYTCILWLKILQMFILTSYCGRSC